ncbi:MAG: hypothetical protein D6704_06175 [Nitrospirae bacterium]|nr:MAG: hypothetical protein D6704_06175 [Nitrospirota bacterium]
MTPDARHHLARTILKELWNDPHVPASSSHDLPSELPAKVEDALSQALMDPGLTVQEAVIQALVHLTQHE